MKKTIQFDLVLQGIDREFKPGMGKGVLVSQQVTFTVSKKELKSSMFARALIEQQDRVIKENIIVKMTEVD